MEIPAVEMSKRYTSIALSAHELRYVNGLSQCLIVGHRIRRIKNPYDACVSEVLQSCASVRCALSVTCIAHELYFA